MLIHINKKVLNFSEELEFIIVHLNCNITFVYLIWTYIQQDVTLHGLFYLEIALHVSGGISTHHHEHTQVYLQHLVFVKPLLLPAAIVEVLEICSNSSTIAAGSSNGLKNNQMQ